MSEIDDYILADDPFLGLDMMDMGNLDGLGELDGIDLLHVEQETRRNSSTPPPQGAPVPLAANQETSPHPPTHHTTSTKKTTKRQFSSVDAQARRAQQNREAQRRHRDRARNKADHLSHTIHQLESEIALYRQLTEQQAAMTAALQHQQQQQQHQQQHQNQQYPSQQPAPETLDAVFGFRSKLSHLHQATEHGLPPFEPPPGVPMPGWRPLPSLAALALPSSNAFSSSTTSTSSLEPCEISEAHPAAHPHAFRAFALLHPHLVRTTEDSWQELTMIDLLLTNTLDLTIFLEQEGLEGLAALLRSLIPAHGLSAALGRSPPPNLLTALGCHASRDWHAVLPLPETMRQALRASFGSRVAFQGPIEALMKLYWPQFTKLHEERKRIGEKVRLLLEKSDTAIMMEAAVRNMKLKGVGGTREEEGGGGSGGGGGGGGGIMSSSSSGAMPPPPPPSLRSNSSDNNKSFSPPIHHPSSTSPSPQAPPQPPHHPASSSSPPTPPTSTALIPAPPVSFDSFVKAMQILALVADGSLQPLLVELRHVIRSDLDLRSECSFTVLRRVLDGQRAAYILRALHPVLDIRALLHVWATAFDVDLAPLEKEGVDRVGVEGGG